MDNLTFLEEFEIDEIVKDGCKVTSYWLKSISCKLSKYGLIKFIYNFSPTKDIIVISSCSVIERAQRLHKQLLGYLLKNKKDYDILIIGCFFKKEKSTKYSYVSNEKLSLLPDTPSHYIKIQDGCNRKCSFCLIKKLRRHYNISPSNIISNIELNYDKNNAYKILGEDIISYYYEGVNFIQLIDIICQKFPYIKLHIPSIYPSCYMVLKLIDLMVKYNYQIEKSLHLSIQHISKNILKYMYRDNYTKEQLIKIYGICNKNNIKLQYDIIVGFPYETNKDFKELLNFIKQYPPQILNIFQYSNIDNVESNKYPQIPSQTKRNRICKLKNELYNIIEEINFQI